MLACDSLSNMTITMKTIPLLSLVLMLALLPGCSEETLNEIDTNPNVVNEAPLSALLPQVLITYANDVLGSGNNTGGFISEQTTRVLGFNGYDNLDAISSSPWERSYLLLNDLAIIKTNAVETQAWGYAGISDVLKAFTLTTLTDLYGDIPFSESGVAEIRTPTFDAHETLYPQIQALLDEAIMNLAKENVVLAPSGDDLVFGGDQAQWTRTAYGLKARLHNKLSRLDAQGSAQNALAALENSFQSSEENFVITIYTGRENGNPLSVSQETQPQSAIGNGIFDVMLSFTPNGIIEEDPRATIWMTTVDGERIPAPNGVAEADFGEPRLDGAIYSKPEFLKFNAADFPMLTYTELQFIAAEAHLRLGNTAEAYENYQRAVRLALEQAADFNPEVALSTAQIDEYLAYPSVSPGEANLTLETILRQKYIYYFQYQWLEAYNETRRNNFVPATNPLGRANRVLYPNSEITRNPNTPTDVDFFSLFEDNTKLVWAE